MVLALTPDRRTRCGIPTWKHWFAPSVRCAPYNAIDFRQRTRRNECDACGADITPNAQKQQNSFILIDLVAASSSSSDAHRMAVVVVGPVPLP